MNLFLFINIVLIYFDDISSQSHDFHVEESFAESKFSEWKDRQNFMELINLFLMELIIPFHKITYILRDGDFRSPILHVVS